MKIFVVNLAAMVARNGKLKLMGIAVAITLGACGGGGDATTPDVVVTMVRDVRYGTFDGLIPILDDEPTTVIVAVINAGIKVRAIRCGSLSPPRDLVSPAVQSPVLFLDVSVDEVEKLKAFKFRVFGPFDQARTLVSAACQ